MNAPASASPWYSLAHLPPGRCRVRLEWSARQFVAARMVNPHTRKLAWCEPPRVAPKASVPLDGWEIVWLPAYGLSEHGPTAWQPENADTYIWPGGVKPEPLTPAGGAMWSERLRFAAVEDAEASDLAREMETEREFAGRGGAGSGADAGGHPKRHQDQPHDKQFWLIATITYSAPGAISPLEAEARLMRAMLTERWVQIERPTCKTFGGILAGMIKPDPLPPGDLAAMDLPPPRWEPNGRDQDDMLTALAWRDALDWDLSTVLELRAVMPPKGWRAIGRELHLSHEAARQLHAAALEALTAVANGKETSRSAARRARLLAVQDGNRAARNQRRRT